MKKILALLLIASAALGMMTYDGGQDRYSMVHLYYGASQARFDFFRSGATPGGQGEGAWVVGTCEMLVNGTVPVVYSYGPPAGEVWAVLSFVMYYEYPGAGTDAEWGDSGAPLTNGVLFRLNNATQTTNLFNMVRNGDDRMAYSFYYPPMILRGDYGETMSVTIRDDLSGGGGMGTTMYFYATGYRIQ
jgi:hypothetical protein